MKKSHPLTEICSFSNSSMNISQLSSLQNLNYLQYIPQIIENTNKAQISNNVIYPLPNLNKDPIPKDTSQIISNNFSFSNLNNQISEEKPNIIINFTIINNYIPKNKKKAKIETDSSNDESNDSTNDNLDDSVKIDEFVSSIRRFVHQLEMNDGEQSIIWHSQLFGISKRRTYDIVNVFESIGCCKKKRCDSIFWIGKDNIKNKLKNLVEINNVDDSSISLEEIFPNDKCIGVSNMTTSLVLLFYIFKTDVLDLRDVAFFLSRDTPRYKTTLNKLYQIAHIMSAIDVMKKTQKTGEVIISTEFFKFDVVPVNKEQNFDFASVESFINTDESKLFKITQKRRKEFEPYVSNNKRR